jgi:DNA polymerase
MSDKVLPGQLSLFQQELLLKPDPERLALLKVFMTNCRKCSLRRSAKNVVFGEGNTNNPIIAFVGEAPGEDEDTRGSPFVGVSGDMLNDMLKAMNIARSDVYICNVVACRPVEGGRNRRPTAEEVALCREWFVGQLRCVQPKLVVALGVVAANALLETRKEIPLHKLREEWLEWQKRPLRVSFHPAYLLRNPEDKLRAWEDLKEVMKRLKEMGLAPH